MRRSAQIIAFLVVAIAVFGLSPSQAGIVTLVPPGAVWDYYDQGRPLPASWKEEAYILDPRYWKSGPAQLGYGDGDEATIVSYGPSSTNKFVTTYFRHEFEIDEADLVDMTQLRLSLLRDDGAAVYLNGTEVFRDNLPVGANYRTFASAGAGNTENTFLDAPPISASLLQPGTNVVAVEVHQVNLTSSDLSMDLLLQGASVRPDFGTITPSIATGFEEALPGATFFDRPEGSTELGWTSFGAGAVAEVGTFTDPNDPNNLHQFHLNDGDGPIEITTEVIDLRNYVDVEVSLDLRTWDTSSGFESADGYTVSLFTSLDGVGFVEIPWFSAFGSNAALANTGTRNGPFDNYVTTLGMIPDDAAAMRIVMELETNSGSEHIMVDNLVVTGTSTISEVAFWDEEGDGNWSDSRWLNELGEPYRVPGERHEVTIGTDVVTQEEDMRVVSLTVNNAGTITLADDVTMIMDAATFEPETTLVLGQNATFSLGGDPATFANVVAGDGADIRGDATIAGTLSLAEGPVTMSISGDLTFPAGSAYSPYVGNGENDKVEVSGNIEMSAGSRIEFRVRGGNDMFEAGTAYRIMSTEGGEGFVGRFETHNLLAYTSGSGLYYSGAGTLMLAFSKDLLPGDADLSGSTDLTDFNIWNANKFTEDTGWAGGDFDGSGATDLSDFNIWNAHKFTSATGGAAPASTEVPEPGTLAMIAAGALLGLLLGFRRRSAR